MSTLSDALAAIRSIVLIEERVRSQGAKLERLADTMVDVDRRLIRVETTLDLLLQRPVGSFSPKAISQDREG